MSSPEKPKLNAMMLVRCCRGAVDVVACEDNFGGLIDRDGAVRG
jgi:hypothetical protein